SGDDTVNLNAGTYTYIATDTNGCADTTTAVINAGPPPFTLTATATTINCYGDSASVNLVASGGAGTLTYSGDDTTNLAAGTYNYTVTDTNGCIATAQVTVAPGPPLFTLSATTTQIACFGGTASVALNVTGGLGTIVITGDDTTNLYAGTYNYTATDSTGCTATVQAVIAAAPDSLIASITATQISCFGLNDGAATAVIVGGTSPYQFLWQTGATTASVTGLVQGTYSVGVMDDRGCTASDSVVISEPLEIVLSGTTVASTCGLNNGSATVSASGGTGTLTYSWAPYGGTAADADSLFADDYTVTVTDSSGCQQQTVLTVSSSSFLIANFGVSAGCQNSLTLFSDSSVASPGSTITSWAWDFGDSSPPDSLVNPSHAFINSGSQNVTLAITSSAGCNASVTLPVNVHALPVADFTSTKVCAGMPTVFNDASTVAGDTISNWDWDFGETNASSTLENPLYTYSAPGDYTTTLIVTSGNGCKDTTNALVTVYANPVVQFSVDDSSGCVVHCPWFTDLTSLPGTSITSWQWNYGDGSPFGSNMTGEHCYTGSGSYTISLTVTTAQGCTSTGTQNNMITVYQLPTADFGFSPSSPVPLIAADIDFTNQSIGSSSWLWDFGDQNDTTGSNEQHPSHIYSDTGTYCITLIAMSNEQCADTIEYCLIVEPEFTFFIPNAFTPFDSQGTNDGFSGYGTNIKEYDMWIFDRWGNMIFHTSDLEVRWDGKANKGKEMAQRDVYVYLVKLVDFRGGEHQYRGTVTLVR
ncbi:MAG: PKD domain-containing protein, partial [Bacteroidia bacterium]